MSLPCLGTCLSQRTGDETAEAPKRRQWRGVGCRRRRRMREHGGSAAAAVRAVQAWEPSIPPWAVLGEFSSLRCPRTWARVHLLTLRLFAASASKAQCRFCVEIKSVCSFVYLAAPGVKCTREVLLWCSSPPPLQPKFIKNHRPRTPGFWDHVCASGTTIANIEINSVKSSRPMQFRHQQFEQADKHAVLGANVCRAPWTTILC